MPGVRSFLADVAFRFDRGVMATERLYKTGTTLERTLRVAYPADRGRIILRTELDWDKDIEADTVSDDGNISTFTVRVDQPFCTSSRAW
jgi:hypothetical protein